MVSDDGSFDDYCETPDGSSSHNGAGMRDTRAVLAGVGGSNLLSKESPVSSSPEQPTSKGEPYGVSSMVLASSGVSRRLDFSKDRISKALSVVRSKKQGMQLCAVIHFG